MYEEGSLRPPSPREVAARRVSLEQIRLGWQPACWEESFCPHENHDGLPLTIGCASVTSAHNMTIPDLAEFWATHNIPFHARLVTDGYDGELALDWTHLKEEK